MLPHSKPGKKVENLESVFEECKAELQYVKSVVMVVILNNAEMLLNFPPSFLQALFSIPKKVLIYVFMEHYGEPKEYYVTRDCLKIKLRRTG